MRIKNSLGLAVSAILFGAALDVRAGAAESALKVPVGTLTVERACRIALENNPQVPQAAERIVAANEVLNQARSAWQPSVSAYGSYLGIDSRTRPDWQPDLRVDQAHRAANAGVQAGWLLFDGFARSANILASQYAVNQSEELLMDVRRLLIRSVSSAFHQAQLAVANMAIAQQNRDFNNILEDDARKRWEAGHSPESEMLNFSVRALQAESDFYSAERSFRIACTVLAQLMALDNAELPPSLYPESSRELGAESLPVFFDMFQYAASHRPDLRAVDLGIQELKQRIRAQKGSYYPKVSLVGGFDYTDQTELTPMDQEEHYSFAGVKAEWDLFTGGRRPAQVREIESNTRRLEERRKEIVLAIQSAIRQSLDSAETAWKIYQRQKEALDLSRRIRDQVEMAYRAGTEPLTRLNEAQTDLVRAAGQTVAGRIQYQLALVDLKSETGEILEIAQK